MFALGNCQSINRNIVECKDGFQNWSKSRCQVLIETLWNVKGTLPSGWSRSALPY